MMSLACRRGPKWELLSIDPEFKLAPNDNVVDEDMCSPSTLPLWQPLPSTPPHWSSSPAPALEVNLISPSPWVTRAYKWVRSANASM
jgi:hypothetical protein